DEGDDVRILNERQRRILGHHEAVDRAAPRRYEAIPLQRLTIAAHGPGRDPQSLAVRAALNAKFVVTKAGPEEFSVGADRRRESAGHQLPVLKRRVRNFWRPMTSPC